MSYLRAEEVLPKELIETIQQYVRGKAIYIPSAERQEWGSGTDIKDYLKKRNRAIYEAYLEGTPARTLADRFALSVKSVQRIIRFEKVAMNTGIGDTHGEQ